MACDSYNRTAEDIALLKSLGATAYRFSLSWTRIIPLGGRDDPVNQKGLDHYVRFVDDLVAAGITPFVTLLHWDVPEELDQRYGGLLNKTEFAADFARYARVVFTALGGKVKHWATFNEPFCSAVLGYNVGQFAPGRTSDRSKNPVGDGTTEPWIAAHTLLVAHGTAVNVLRTEFPSAGEIGIVINGDAVYPWDPASADDIEACERKLEFTLGWFADPIFRGDYPASMRAQLGKRLPVFTPEERALVQGSADYYGMNHYTANYIRNKTTPPDPLDVAGNLDILFTNKAGYEVGPETQSSWLRPCATGFRDLLNWISSRYGRPKIYVTENGTSIKGENDMTPDEILEDGFRAKYYDDYVRAMATAVALDGVDVRGYFAWSLMDNFEWADGYETRFGVCFVDYENGQKRHPKKSAKVLAPLFDELMVKRVTNGVAH